MTPIVKGRDCRLIVDGAELGDISPKNTCPHCYRSRYLFDYLFCEDCENWVCSDCHTTYRICLQCRDKAHMKEGLL